MNVVRILLLCMMLLLVGCDRQVGEAIQPTVGQAPPTMTPVDEVDSGDLTDDPLAPLSEETPAVDIGDLDAAQEDLTAEDAPTLPVIELNDPNFPPITIIAPTRVLPTVAPEVDEAELSLTAFITPGVPSGLVPMIPTQEPETPTPTGGAFTATPSGLVTPTQFGAVATDPTGCTYAVKAGDNLFRIATNNNTTVEQMRLVNPELVGNAPILQPGQLLNIPNCAQDASASAPTDVPSASNDTPATAGQVYIVKGGDTLGNIASRNGTTIEVLIQLNQLTDPHRLSIGQEIILPSGQ